MTEIWVLIEECAEEDTQVHVDLTKEALLKLYNEKKQGDLDYVKERSGGDYKTNSYGLNDGEWYVSDEETEDYYSHCSFVYGEYHSTFYSVILRKDTFYSKT